MNNFKYLSFHHIFTVNKNLSNSNFYIYCFVIFSLIQDLGIGESSSV